MCTPNIPIYVGMMSGTSMDGVDAVACVFNEKGCQFIARSFEPYSDMLRESLLSLCQTGPDEVFRMQNGANEIAKIYAKAFNKLLTDSGLNYKNIR
ncbi:anhydro-N-acetylmuramic acid kinase, partial [uncultured Parasutterella sp.]